MSIEAMKQALEAMNAMMTHMGMDEDEWNKVTFDQMRKAITSLRQAIAKTEKQEPVAWIGEGGMKSITDIEKQAWIQAGRAELVETYNKALYTHPQPKAEQPKVRTGDCLLVGVCASEGHKIQPKRKWVGLSREDCYQIRETESTDFMYGVAWAEAKLKEKNT